MANHLDILEHFCFKNIQLRLITGQEIYVCTDCDFSISKTFDISLKTLDCINCGRALDIQAPKVTGELHAELCTSKYAHYSSWYKEGKISKEDYSQWVSTLSPAEKTGHYAPAATHRINCLMSDEEVGLRTTNPDKFKEVVLQKLKDTAANKVKHLMVHSISFKDNKLD